MKKTQLKCKRYKFKNNFWARQFSNSYFNKINSTIAARLALTLCGAKNKTSLILLFVSRWCFFQSKYFVILIQIDCHLSELCCAVLKMSKRSKEIPQPKFLPSIWKIFLFVFNSLNVAFYFTIMRLCGVFTRPKYKNWPFLCLIRVKSNLM